MFRCARIQGLDTMEGLLLFGKEHLYIVDGFTLLKSREIRDIDSVPLDLYEPILPAQGPTTTSIKRHCSKFSYEDIRLVVVPNHLMLFYRSIYVFCFFVLFKCILLFLK